MWGYRRVAPNSLLGNVRLPLLGWSALKEQAGTRSTWGGLAPPWKRPARNSQDTPSREMSTALGRSSLREMGLVLTPMILVRAGTPDPLSPTESISAAMQEGRRGRWPRTRASAPRLDK